MKNNAFTLAEGATHVDVPDNSRKFAFTLAEVLVTLGIIGVVSALTLPTLIKDHQRQTYTVQLQKVFNELSQAAEQVKVDSNSRNLRESQLRRRGSGFLLTNYFKTTQRCDNNSLGDCFSNDYINMNGDNVTIGDFISENSSCAVIASGASICVEPMSGAGWIDVVADINGKQGPNVIGRDVFTLSITNNGTVRPAGEADIGNCQSATDTDYGACLAQIIQDGWKMDY